MAARQRLYLSPLEMINGLPVAEFVYPLAEEGFLYGVFK